MSDALSNGTIAGLPILAVIEDMPPPITTRVDGTSSFARLTTQTTSPPLCYETVNEVH